MALDTAIRAGRAFVELFADDSPLQRSLSRADRRLKRWGGATQATGRRMLAAGTVFSAPFVLAAKKIGDFGDAMAKVRAKTLGTTDDEFQTLTNTAKDLGRTTSFTAVEVASGMDFLAQAGLNAQQIIEGIPDALNLARAGAVELGFAADVVSDVAQTFGGSMAAASDMIVAAANNSNTSVELMSGTFSMAAASAQVAGMSLDEFAVAAGTLGSNFIKGTAAGTGLQGILAALGSTAKRAKIEGLVGPIAGRKALDVLTDLGDATRNMEPLERLGLFFEIFDRRAGRSAITLADNADEIARLRQVMAGAEGTAARTATVMDDTLGGSFRMLLSAVEGVQIAIGEALEPTIRRLAGFLTTALGPITKWVEENQELVLALGLAGPGLLALGAALIPLGSAASLLGTSLSLIGGLLSIGATPTGAVAIAVGLLTGAFEILRDEGARTAHQLSGIFGTLKESLATLFSEGIGDVREALRLNDFELAARIIKNTFIVAWSEIKSAALRAWDALIDGFRRAIHRWVFDDPVSRWIFGIEDPSTLAPLPPLARPTSQEERDARFELREARKQLNDLKATQPEAGRTTTPGKPDLFDQIIGDFESRLSDRKKIADLEAEYEKMAYGRNSELEKKMEAADIASVADQLVGRTTFGTSGSFAAILGGTAFGDVDMQVASNTQKMAEDMAFIRREAQAGRLALQFTGDLPVA